MTTKTIRQILTYLVLFTSISCATYETQYHESVVNWENESFEAQKNVDHIFYLIGDAGNAVINQDLPHFKLLHEELNASDNNATVLFLGDNIYQKGLPKKDHPERALAEHRLNAQINLVKDFKGQPIFLPGNHDYYSNGVKGLKRQENYIEDALNRKNVFLPENGCPIEKVEISDDLVLLIVDSQWFLEDWDKNPTMNDDCEINNRVEFFDELEGQIKKAEGKTVVIAMHHPLYTNGPHGGQYSFKMQFYPVKNKVPLPILGTMINGARKMGGFSPQDNQNPLYTEFVDRVSALTRYSDRLIFATGHEHSLQLLDKGNYFHIISGSGSKSTPTRNANDGLFSSSEFGYAKLIVYKDGSSDISFIAEKNSENEVLFKSNLYKAETEIDITPYKKAFPEKIVTSNYTENEVSKGKGYRRMWGDHYRKEHGTKLEVQTVNLDTLYGGLTPVRQGGGFQSKSIRLVDKEGREFIMRDLKKNATQFLQKSLFTDQIIKDEFDNTTTEALLYDFFTASHPYTPFIVGDLSDLIGIYHTNPKLFYIPKQPALKHYNLTYGDHLYMVEERAADGHGHLASFGYSNELISTSDMLRKLRKSDNNKIDHKMYIRARLFDMALGDWDRHGDQWRWAEFETKNGKTYRPVPRDRDQAFSEYDGTIAAIARALIPDARKFQTYTEEVTGLKWLNRSGYILDTRLLNASTLKEWETEAKFIQTHLTNDAIDKAFSKLPEELDKETTARIKRNLNRRISSLNITAKEYYDYLIKNPILVGNDKDNLIEIERKPNGVSEVKMFNIKDGEKGSKFYEKSFSNKETRELWIYGMDDKDVFKVTGATKNVIPLRLIGGQNNDTYHIESGKRVTMYDYKSKENTVITNKGNERFADNYERNIFNDKKYFESVNTFIPMLGYNPDHGLKLGFNETYIVNAFERNPFSQRYNLKFAYYFAHNGFELTYDMEFAHVFNNWNLLFESKLTSPNYSINFFGFGNETINYENDFDANYHRVRVSYYNAAPYLKWNGRLGGSFKIGGIFESIAVEDTEGRFIENQPVIKEERQYYSGFKAVHTYKNEDNSAYPNLAFNTALEVGWKSNLENSKENNAYVNPMISFSHKVGTSGRVVFGTKLKGEIIIGDNFEFYNAAGIGGKNGLRGYRDQRFIGKTAFYQNSDIRVRLSDLKTPILPLKIGLFGGFDYGRVWMPDEDSSDWKTSYGGGFWMTGADLMNFNISIFKGKENPYFQFGFGFQF